MRREEQAGGSPRLSKRSGMPTDKCCGTCKWWERFVACHITPKGFCNVKLVVPESFTKMDTRVMEASEGTNCPCWERKGEEDGHD